MNDPENRRYLKLGLTGAAVLAAGAACYLLLLHLGDLSVWFGVVLTILMPFVYGAVIAYILAPLCGRLEKLLGRCLPGAGAGLVSSLAIVLSLLLALAVVFVLVMLVFPQVWASLVRIADAIPGQLAAANAFLHDILRDQPELQTYWDTVSAQASGDIINWLKNEVLPNVGAVVGTLGTQLMGFFGVIKNLFLGILISIYFLASRRQFAAQARLVLNGIFPARRAALIEEEAHYADRMFNGFLMGKLVDSAIIGALCFAGTALMGIRSAALVSVIVGVTNIIPFFGPFLGAIPSALLLLLENPMHCLYFLVFVVILQQLDGNVIGPKILGDSTGLSSFWVLFSILLFGGLWGIPGMIVGVPLFAVIYDIVRKLTRQGLARHGSAEMLDSYNEQFHPAAPKEKQ